MADDRRQLSQHARIATLDRFQNRRIVNKLALQVPSSAVSRMANGRNIPCSTPSHGISPPLRPTAMRAVVAIKARAGSCGLLKALCVVILAVGGLSLLAEAARAQQFSSEKDAGELRLGQRVKVDDGTCPAGQVKEISGTKMTAGGVVRTRKCIPRTGTKHK
jgi:hypothetical protein